MMITCASSAHRHHHLYFSGCLVVLIPHMPNMFPNMGTYLFLKISDSMNADLIAGFGACADTEWPLSAQWGGLPADCGALPGRILARGWL